MRKTINLKISFLIYSFNENHYSLGEHEFRVRLMFNNIFYF